MRLKNLVIVLMIVDFLSIKIFVDCARGMFYTLMSMQHLVELDANVTDRICNRFMKQQRPICSKHVLLIPSVVQGVKMGMHECQHQFTNHHWNCAGHNISVSPDYQTKRKNKNTYLDNLINKGVPESAFLLAITSASVAHQVAKACSTGHNPHCGCDRTAYEVPKGKTFQWAGCSENVHFGAAFSKRFLDVPHKKKIKLRPTLGLVNLHNSHAGTKVVINSMEMKCKCHGVSGSCETKTCYRALPSLRVVGGMLKERFLKASTVEVHDYKLLRLQSHDRHVNEDDLVYIESSPDFCSHNPKYGSLGTRGRQCNSTLDMESPDTEGSCEHLCCKRGYTSTEYIYKEKCRCKFIWCCNVECDTCEVKKLESRCQ